MKRVLQAEVLRAQRDGCLTALDSSHLAKAGAMSRRACLASIAGGLVAAMSPSDAWSARPPRPSSDSGVSSREVRDVAVRELPLTKLSREDRNRVARVVNDAAVFRRLPTQTIACDAQLYTFLIQHPDLVVNLWRVLGISEVALERTGPNQFRTDDKQGTQGTIEILHADQSSMLALADGMYDGALFTRRVRGRCVLALKNGEYQGENQEPIISTRLDVFIQIENVGAELLVKSFQPLVGHFADHNFRETAHFVETLNRAAQVNPGKIEQLANKMNDISPVTRQQFVAITNQLAARVAERDESVDIEPPQLARRPDGSLPLRK